MLVYWRQVRCMRYFEIITWYLLILWEIKLNIHWVFFGCFLEFGSHLDTEAISHNKFTQFNPLRASFSQQNGKIDFVGDTFNHTNQV